MEKNNYIGLVNFSKTDPKVRTKGLKWDIN